MQTRVLRFHSVYQAAATSQQLGYCVQHCLKKGRIVTPSLSLLRSRLKKFAEEEQETMEVGLSAHI